MRLTAVLSMVCMFFCTGVSWGANQWEAYGEIGPVQDICFEGNYVWIATQVGLMRCNRITGGERVRFTTADGLAENWVTCIGIGPDGSKWFGTDSKGITRYDGHTWKTYTMADGLAYDQVLSVAFSNDGAVWIGTRCGLSRFDGEI